LLFGHQSTSFVWTALTLFEHPDRFANMVSFAPCGMVLKFNDCMQPGDYRAIKVPTFFNFN
jgi:hypothetical protein